MALTEFQRTICRLIAANRIEQGESYIAGGAALNALLESSRLSRDLDLFHDTDEALLATWDADRALLETNGCSLEIVRERATFVEARITRGGDGVLAQWTRDSAFRFFPLVRHDDLGLTLHPYDLATNEVLALVGRLEVRDWIDVIECHRHVQRLGYLAWVACGKDPGFSPRSILEHARRSSRYSAVEVAELDFDGPPPDASALSTEWRGILEEADRIISALPSEEAGTCVVDDASVLFAGPPAAIAGALRRGALRFHAGSIRGALPQILNER